LHEKKRGIKKLAISITRCFYV